jgi:hypothetical protein
MATGSIRVVYSLWENPKFVPWCKGPYHRHIESTYCRLGIVTFLRTFSQDDISAHPLSLYLPPSPKLARESYLYSPMLPLSPSLWSVPTCPSKNWELLGVTKRCHLSWLTNSALVLYDAGEGGGSCGCGVSANEYSCLHGVHTPYLTYGFWQFQLLVCIIVNVFNRQSSLNIKPIHVIILIDPCRLSWGGGGGGI